MIGLSNLERRLFEALCARGDGMTLDELCDATYAHRADGGALYAKVCVALFVMRINAKFRDAGLWLYVRTRNRRYRVYVRRPSCSR